MSANNVNSGAANSEFNAVKEFLAKLPISVRISEAIKPAIVLPLTLNAASPGEDVTINSCIQHYATIQQASSDDQAHKVVRVLTSTEFIEHQEYNLPNGKPIPSLPTQRHILEKITKERTCNTAKQFPESSTSNEVTIQSGNNSAAEWDTAEIHVMVEVNMELESQENAMEQDTDTMDSIASTPTLETQAKSPITIAKMEAPPTLILSSSILPTQTANNLPTLSSLRLRYPDSEMDVRSIPTPSTENDSPQNEDITMDSSVSTLLFPVHDSPTSSPHSCDSIMAQGHPSPGSIRESISSNLENDLVMKTSPSSEHNPTHNLTHAELGRHIHHLITQAAHELQEGSTATQSAPTTPETPSRFAKKPWKFSEPPSAPAKMENTITRHTRSASKKTPASPSSSPPPTPTTRPLNSISPCPFCLYHNNEEAIMVFESDDENAELFQNGVLVEDEQGNLTIQVPYSQGAFNLMAAMQSGTPTARENPETEDVSPGQAGPSIPTAPRPTHNSMSKPKPFPTMHYTSTSLPFTSEETQGQKASKKTTNNTST
ncbi:hypothetical protein BDN71DRAFT_1512761 [Pleurotus eryngii]|uniref:Uncharacterized protein n=1 Tax=Pleurotus eryngii TaxID=5323 RepID=A0A9P5ZN13_PLEER|nr:hypothetical protein BDN71DRAFT_1512761 [Pleurotus eryngii]